MTENEQISDLEKRLTSLQSDSKQSRKDALHQLNYEIFESPNHTDADLAFVFNSVYSHILKGFNDDSEACREKSAEIIANFIDKLPLNDYYLTFIIPVLVRRLGSPSIVEESEELRLVLVSLVSKIIHKYKKTTQLVPFFDDFTAILTRTSTDPFSKVKIESCETIILLTEVLKKDFHLQSETYVAPVLQNFTHQHCKVREAAVRCVGAVVMVGTAKAFELSITPMAERLFDDNVNVRQQVTIEVGNWMLHLRDRYSYWHRMVPLLLTSMSDAMESVRSSATQLWDDVGRQFMEENEEDLKKKTDFLVDAPSHYPPDLSRPNLGCRTIVQRNIGKIIPAIAREMDGWQEDARLRVSQLLCWLILAAEEGCTQHANAICHVMVRGAKDDDTRIRLEIDRAAELYGYFVQPITWWPLLKPEMESWGVVSVLQNIIRGTEPEQLKTVVEDIANELSLKVNCQARNQKYQMALLSTVGNILECSEAAAVQQAPQLFEATFSVLAISDSPEIVKHAQDILNKLSAAENADQSIEDLYEKHLSKVLSDITSDAVTWVLSTPDRCILECALDKAGRSLGSHLHLVAPLLKDCLTTPKVDPEVKLKMFTTLTKLMISKETVFKNCDHEKLKPFLTIVLQEIIVPNLVWTPGRVAEAIRTSAISCLCAVMQNTITSANNSTEHLQGTELNNMIMELFPGDNFEPFVETVVPLVTGLVDDNAHATRCYSLKAISCLARLASANGSFTADILHKMYFVVLKRLDDSNDRVRSTAVHTLRTLFKLRPSDYDLESNGAHVDALYSALLVHLDDLDENFRQQMEDALIELSNVDPIVLLKKLKANIQLYRNRSAYEKLMEHIQKTEIKK